jgi:uncharacterized protein YjdB
MFSMFDNQSVINVPQEFDTNNNPVTIVPANLRWNTNDTTIATVDMQSDGSGKVTGVKPGSCLIRIQDLKFGLNFSDTLTLTPAPGDPTRLIFTWGTPS